MIGTFWPSVTEPRGERFERSLDYIIERFQIPIVTGDKLSLPGFAFSTFRGDYRSLPNHEASHAIGYDLDGPGTNLDRIAHDSADLCGIIYSSYRHRPDAHRGRAQVWLDRPATTSESRRLRRALLPRFPTAGREASDPSRLWFMPGIAPGGEYRFIELGGALVDVDATLAAAPEIIEPTEIPAPVVPLGQARGGAVERARRYLDRCDVAISGAGGHRQTFIVAQKMVRGFCLDEETAYALLTVWNLRCEPPWSAKDLRRKVHEAATRGTMRPGALLDARREGRAA
jgi:hypothetical protein